MIKVHHNRNEYYNVGDNLWVRNFTNPLAPPLDINHLIPEADRLLLLENETINQRRTIQQIDTEDFNFPAAVLVSNGYGFTEHQHLLEELAKELIVLGVNGTLMGWRAKRRLNFYVVNHPYPECLSLLPPRAVGWPRCIASIRTYPPFLDRYGGLLFQYTPVPNEDFGGRKGEAAYLVDDYRSPLCAALSLCFRFKVQKLVLFCCNEAFAEERPGAVAIAGHLFAYPPQLQADRLVNGQLFWLKRAGLQIASFQGSPLLTQATPVEDIHQVKAFLADN